MDTRRILRDGAAVGLIAYGAVAAFYSAFDFLAARGPLFTVNLLGLAVFRGLRDPGVLQLPVPLDIGAIFLYNAFHLAASLAIGLVVMSLAAHADRHPRHAGPVLLLIVAGFVLTVIVVSWLSAEIRVLLPWWSIVLANALAVALSAWYLSRRNPSLTRRLLPPLVSTGGGAADQKKI
jgi:hypothetical protein